MRARPPVMIPLLLLALACGGGGGEDEGDGGAAAPEVPVGIGYVVRDTISQVLRLSGRLAPVPGGSAALSAPTAGQVRDVRVHLGTRVRAGEHLLTVDAPEIESRASELTAAAGVARREAGRQSDLLAQGIVSQKAADQAEAAAVAAEAQARGAEALRARTRITSPITGAVQRVAVQEGEHVDAGAMLVEVVRSDTLSLALTVPSTDLPALHRGQVAMIRVAGDATEWTGVVQDVAPAVDTLTNTGQALVRVPNTAGRLRSGTAAVAQIRLGVRPDAIVVPDSALVLVGDSLAVFVIGPDSVAHARSVTVGVRDGGRAEVQGQVAPGDRVATTGAYGLQDGMRVIPRDGP